MIQEIEMKAKRIKIIDAIIEEKNECMAYMISKNLDTTKCSNIKNLEEEQRKLKEEIEELISEYSIPYIQFPKNFDIVIGEKDAIISIKLLQEDLHLYDLYILKKEEIRIRIEEKKIYNFRCKKNI